MTMFSSSNEFPEDREALAAIYDRLAFRMNVDGLRDNKNIEKMLMDQAGRNNQSLQNTVVTRISIDEIKALNEAALQITVPKGIVKMLLKVQNSVSKTSGVVISDRKKNQCVNILQSHALYKGRGHVAPEDFTILKYVFYDEGVDLSEVESEINKQIDPYTDEINKHYKQFLQIKESIENETDEQQKLSAITSLGKSLNLIITNMSNAISKAQASGQDVKEFLNKRDSISQYQTVTLSAALGLNVNIQSNNFTQSNPGVDFSDLLGNINVVDQNGNQITADELD